MKYVQDNCRKCEEKYVNKKYDAKDQKEMWRAIKNHIEKKNRSAIESMIFNQIEYKENSDIANWFNKCFVTV